MYKAFNPSLHFKLKDKMKSQKILGMISVVGYCYEQYYFDVLITFLAHHAGKYFFNVKDYSRCFQWTYMYGREAPFTLSRRILYCNWIM